MHAHTQSAQVSKGRRGEREWSHTHAPTHAATHAHKHTLKQLLIKYWSFTVITLVLQLQNLVENMDTHLEAENKKEIIVGGKRKLQKNKANKLMVNFLTDAAR